MSSPSPRSGDRVRAVVDDREAETVEGILHIRYVPSLRHAQVNVIVDGDSRDVRPASIEVLRTCEIAIEELEASDPIVGEEGWRTVDDIDQARDEGLLLPQAERFGGTWDDLSAELHERVLPLLHAGWTVTGTEREPSNEFGDSVFYDLRRGATIVNLEYYEHGQLVAYPGGEMPEEKDGEPADPFFSIYDSTPASSRAAFEEQGWLGPR